MKSLSKCRVVVDYFVQIWAQIVFIKDNFVVQWMIPKQIL